MKPNCILCNKQITMKNERYIYQGNFCNQCNASCGILAKLYHGEVPVTPDTTGMNETRKEKIMERYKMRLEKWIEKKHYYERMSNEFQLKLNH